MQLKNLLTDDDAVSPVIGVILMVAITVILAAVIAAFVLGLGESDEVGPQVSFDWDFSEGANAGEGDLTITHQSGDGFTASTVALAGDVGDSGNATLTADGGAAWYEIGDNDYGPDSSISAGDRVEIIDGLGSDFDLDLVWTSTDGSDSNIIGSRSGPDS